MDNSHSPKVPHRAGPVGGAANVHDRLKGHESTSELRENVNAGLEPDAPKSPTLKSLGGMNSAGQQTSTAKDNKPSLHSATLRRLTESKDKQATPCWFCLYSRYSACACARLSHRRRRLNRHASLTTPAPSGTSSEPSTPFQLLISRHSQRDRPRNPTLHRCHP